MSPPWQIRKYPDYLSINNLYHQTIHKTWYHILLSSYLVLPSFLSHLTPDDLWFFDDTFRRQEHQCDKFYDLDSISEMRSNKYGIDSSRSGKLDKSLFYLCACYHWCKVNFANSSQNDHIDFLLSPQNLFVDYRRVCIQEECCTYKILMRRNIVRL